MIPLDTLTKDLDISLALPHSCDTVQSAAKISGYAAELREKRKMTKYGPTCIPLVLNTDFSDPMAEDYLDKISKISKDANGRAAKQTLEIDGERNCL